MRGYTVRTDVDLDQVPVQVGDFVTAGLAETVNHLLRNDLAVESWQDLGQGRQTIVFCVNVQHAHDMAEAFLDRGIQAGTVVGTTPRAEREATIEAFRRGEFPVLTGCQVFLEGFDVPPVSCIIWARPTQSQLLYCQGTGRGLRRAEGKEDLVVIDLVDNTRRHQLAGLPALFGLPPKLQLAGEDLTEALDEIEEAQAQDPYLPLEGAASLEEIQWTIAQVDVLGRAPVTPPAAKSSLFAWISVPNGLLLALPPRNGRRETLLIQENLLGQWEIILRATEKSNGGGWLQHKEALGHYAGAEEAVRAADLWVRHHHRQAQGLLSRDAAWRAEAPTDAQLQWLRRKRIPFDPERITKGEAQRLLAAAFNSD